MKAYFPQLSQYLQLFCVILCVSLMTKLCLSWLSLSRLTPETQRALGGETTPNFAEPETKIKSTHIAKIEVDGIGLDKGESLRRAVDLGRAYAGAGHWNESWYRFGVDDNPVEVGFNGETLWISGNSLWIADVKVLDIGSSSEEIRIALENLKSQVPGTVRVYQPDQKANIDSRRWLFRYASGVLIVRERKRFTFFDLAKTIDMVDTEKGFLKNQVPQ